LKTTDKATAKKRAELVVRKYFENQKERNVPIIKKALAAMGPAKKKGPIFLQVHPDTFTHRFNTTATLS